MKNTSFGHFDANQKIVYADNPAMIGGAVVHNPSKAQYNSLDPAEKELHLAYPTDPAPTGYHYEEDGYDETATDITKKWKAVADPTVYRKFSKLKIYGAIISLPDSNGTTAWEKVKAWLEAKTIEGVNGWMAFQLAQEVSEDHPLFAALAEEARVLLGLTQEQFEALLAQCVLDGGVIQ